MANVTLQHPNVNGGTAVELPGVTGITFGWNNLNNVDPVPGKYDIVENNFGGFENPKIVIGGSFDVEDIGANELTQELLVNFATLRSEIPITLTIPVGSTPQYLKGRPSGGYKTDGTNSLQNTIKVWIDSFDIRIDTTSEQGRFWTYSITMHETI